MYAPDYLLSSSAQQAIRLAEQLASEYAHPSYGAAHLLWAVAAEDVGLHDLLKRLGVEAVGIQKWALAQVEKYPKANRYIDTPSADESAVAVLKETQKLCLRYGTSEITPIEMLEALCTPEVGFKADLLRRLPIALYEIIEWRSKNPSDVLSSASASGHGNQASDSLSGPQAQQVLQKYCEDLTALARAGKMDPLIGRDRELKQLIEILGKRISPNVLIVGEPGVGKTAILGGLAMNIIDGNVPERLKSATIFELDVSGRLVAGAYKGEVEERLKSVLKAVKSYGEKALLFIDEVHVLLDERGSVGSGVVNLLKPELARGELTVIGATTQAEYQKYVEKDSAFNRRFSRLVIEEPDEQLATTMLHGLASKYEEFHGLKVQQDAIAQSVKLAKRYVGERCLPASAIELLDFTMSCAAQMNASSSRILDGIEQEWQKAPAPSAQPFLQTLRARLSELMLAKLGDEPELQAKPFPDLISDLRAMAAEPKVQIEAEDIEAMIAYRTGIPIGRLRSKEQDKFKNIEEKLQSRVVGQDHVLKAVGHALKAFRANIKEPREPGAIFFFTGPTGTGKTELAKAIAELLFDDENFLIRFDMSEFQESHSVASLLGSPPGYVGYEEGGLLVNKVRKQPYSVVLFDEIEKAHPDIYGIFLQMLTDSRLQDKQGKLADFSNTIIIFTSNAGADGIVELFQQGTLPSPEQLKAILRQTRCFKDEFLGRVDSQILPFAPISEPVARLILNIHFNKFARLLRQQHQVGLVAADAVMEYLIKVGFSPLYGARPLKNAIKTFLVPPIADKIILGELAQGDEVHLAMDEGANEIAFEIHKPARELAVTN
jgi:ATP-dependent Clp protease ATP-binding subunit ClpB